MIRYLMPLFLLVVATPITSFASDEMPSTRNSSKDTDVSATGSAASFDQRLPPVIPGEEIQHNGRKMKVWSTSGPVPVGQVPQAPQPPQAPVNGQQNLYPNGNVGVIIDNRPANRR